MTPLRLGIIANTGKPRVPDVISRLLDHLERRSIPFVVSADLVPFLNRSNLPACSAEQLADRVDFVLSFGGDGTFLQTAWLVAPREVPIVGVNLGGFGYLAEVSIEQLDARLDDLLNARFAIQERFMVEANIPDQGRMLALNDIVIDKGGFTRTIRQETTVDGEYLNTFHGDGLIVATPTGSTAYSLSVGGPIVEPGVDAMVIVPISPHMLANRPLVVEGGRRMVITTFSHSGWFQVTADGQRSVRLPTGQQVAIGRATCKTRIVHFGGSTFYSLLRNKLHWRTKLVEGAGDDQR